MVENIAQFGISVIGFIVGLWVIVITASLILSVLFHIIEGLADYCEKQGWTK